MEYQLPGINQIHVNAAVGLSFSSVLRSVLRQDPDIILVGEIRDNETADIAIKAALTGHLVLSTLHTNNAAGRSPLRVWRCAISAGITLFWPRPTLFRKLPTHRCRTGRPDPKFKY